MVRNRKETTEKSKKKPGLSTQIFIALLAGALLGVVIHYWIPSSYIKDTVIVEGVLYVIGQGFIRLMQMLVVPLVFCSLVCGFCSVKTALDLIGNMRDYLNGTSAEITMTFFLKNRPVNLTGCYVGILAQTFIDESFIMSKV